MRGNQVRRRGDFLAVRRGARFQGVFSLSQQQQGLFGAALPQLLFRLSQHFRHGKLLRVFGACFMLVFFHHSIAGIIQARRADRPDR
ncbi:MAG TPA: hypothetical protein PKC13_11255 [Blastocatellia bacterium]|nr:hypothetical protein [Blastocatellia bacterium]HMX26172.1 hypothetical protein [Blastocatellia bacterium]HMY71823.1 hypothetical protein [Blastocatellia bacterium]